MESEIVQGRSAPEPETNKEDDATTLRRRLGVDALWRGVVDHPLYSMIRSEQELRIFMRSHVFCVWDFQSLMTALQLELANRSVPWIPNEDRLARRMLNEIVLDEESDEDPDGGYASHYELYLSAMEVAGADTAPMKATIERLRSGLHWRDALASTELPPGTADFVRTTLEVASGGPNDGRLHERFAAFTIGREDLIPDMFTKLVRQLAGGAPQQWSKFLYYLERHIECDGDRHGPMARTLLTRLCGDDERKWQEAGRAAADALNARRRLWGCLAQQLQQHRSN